VALDGALFERERETGGELAQQREQRQVRSRRRLESMWLRLLDRGGAARDGRSQGSFELAESGFRSTIPLR
jgi:hypothetical protein